MKMKDTNVGLEPANDIEVKYAFALLKQKLRNGDKENRFILNLPLKSVFSKYP